MAGVQIFYRFLPVIALVLFVNCQTPVETEDPLGDLAERASVWQYCKAWSIYQDSSSYAGRILPGPFEYNTPQDIFDRINDTLGFWEDSSGKHSHIYTRYLSNEEMAEMQSGQVTGAAAPADPEQTVFLDTLTDSTVMVTISVFAGRTWDDFNLVIPKPQMQIGRFPNVIVDVRGNSGGLIRVADSIISAIVPEKTHYIMARQRESDTTAKNTYRTIKWHDWITKTPPRPGFAGKRFAVLINRYSASASEILAAALYEGAPDGPKRTLLVGDTSYGKGIGQIRIARRTRQWMEISFLQMKGVSGRIGDYHRRGIIPDTVPAPIIRQIDSLYASESSYKRDAHQRYRKIYYAVKMLEPGIADSAIQYPGWYVLAKQAQPSAQAGLYKVIHVDD